MSRFIAAHPGAWDDVGMDALLARRDELPSALIWRAGYAAEADHTPCSQMDASEGRLFEEATGAFGCRSPRSTRGASSTRPRTSSGLPADYPRGRAASVAAGPGERRRSISM